MESIANFYIINSSSFFAYYYFKKHKNLTIKNSLSQLLDNLTQV